MTAANGSTVHLSRSTPTTSMCPMISTGFFDPFPFSTATSDPRPGAGSKRCVSIPAARIVLSRYFATGSSLPGGFVVFMRIIACRCSSVSLLAEDQSGSWASTGTDESVMARATMEARKKGIRVPEASGFPVAGED